MDRPTDQLDDDAQLAQEAESVRLDREALLVEQAEWEQLRTQVEAGLADLERRLLEQVERLRAPRDAEEFRVALEEQLALSVERTEAAEARHAEMQTERDELVAALAESTDDEAAVLKEERDDLQRQLNEALTDLAESNSDQAAALQEERDELQRRLNEALADLAAASNESSAANADSSDRHAEAEAQITTLRAQLTAQGEANSTALSEARRQRDEAESRLEEASDRLLAIAGADGELARLRRERDTLSTELETERQQNEKQASETQALNERAEALAAECDAFRESAAQAESERAGLIAAAEQYDREREELVAQLAVAEQAIPELEATRKERDELAQQTGDLQAEAERLRGELDSAASEAAQRLETERTRTAELREKLAVAEQASPEADRLRDELEATQQNLRKQRDRVARLEGELSAWAANAEPGSGELDSLRRERDELQTQLEAALAAPAAAPEAPVDNEAMAELQEKFDLALADLQSHRDHIAELERKLLAGPDLDAGAADQEELQRLREERDELLHRLEEASATPDVPEEVEDLRARFELAVEDVRRLKTENANLEQQLANSDSLGGENDWEAQKRRLLASLENEGETEDAERTEERTTIQGTIQITDQVVAEKDREIEKLKGWLAETGSETPVVDDTAAQALLDEDAIVQQERERLAGLEADLREKLRSVELELSVERAKISRAQAEIDEQQLELETLRAATSLAAEAADGTAPKRRWLDKLGLSGEGQ